MKDWPINYPIILFCDGDAYYTIFIRFFNTMEMKNDIGRFLREQIEKEKQGMT